MKKNWLGISIIASIFLLLSACSNNQQEITKYEKKAEEAGKTFDSLNAKIDSREKTLESLNELFNKNKEDAEKNKTSSSSEESSSSAEKSETTTTSEETAASTEEKTDTTKKSDAEVQKKLDEINKKYDDLIKKAKGFSEKPETYTLENYGSFNLEVLEVSTSYGELGNIQGEMTDAQVIKTYASIQTKSLELTEAISKFPSDFAK